MKSGILTYTVNKNNDFSEDCADKVRDAVRYEFIERLSEKNSFYKAIDVKHHDTLFILNVPSLYGIQAIKNLIVSIFHDIYEEVVEEQEYDYDKKQITIHYLLSIDNEVLRRQWRVK